MEGGPNEESATKRESFVLVHNVAKKHNIGTLVRSAVAFGVKQVVLVGRRDFNSFGSHGSSDFIQFKHFHSLTEAKNYFQVHTSYIYK
jgi:tRNA G18 (ribose-2'-O)-methylase SpoU